MGKAEAENCISRTCLRIMAAKINSPRTCLSLSRQFDASNKSHTAAPGTSGCAEERRESEKRLVMHQADATRVVLGSGALRQFI
jgi:hypothetical protein